MRQPAEHAVLRRITGGCAIASVAIFAVGIALLFSAPDKIEAQTFWGPLKDIGPAIAGSWVLCAALLAVTAAGITAVAAAEDSEKRTRQRSEAIHRVCIGEIRSFWSRCNHLLLHARLTDHIAWLKRASETEQVDVFRRSMGDDWFSFFRADPESIGELDAEISSRYIALSALARLLASRLNWLNSCRAADNERDFWIRYHNDTLEMLNDLYTPSTDLLRRLGDRETDPHQFTF